jgi:hypothetical protein
MGGPGDVAVRVFPVLAHVQHAGARVAGVGQRGGPRGQPAGRPGGHPTGQLADEPVVADLVALAHQLGAVLVGTDHEHERRVPLDQPAQPRRELAAADRQHPGCDPQPSIDGSCVDHSCAAVDEPPEGVKASGQTGLRAPGPGVRCGSSRRSWKYGG